MGEMTREHLASCNPVPVYGVEDAEFRTYGRVLKDYDFSGLISYLKERTTIPKQGNLYVPSEPGMEADACKKRVSGELYGGMPVQIGYCNGRNQSYNGFEYHKCSEINVAATDLMLVLGHVWDMKNNTYHTDDAQVFFVKEGTAVELYQTTLHLSPCRVTDEGYRAAVILAEGTNLPLPDSKEDTNLSLPDSKEDTELPLPDPKAEGTCPEERQILLKRNKWIIAHPDWEPLRQQGAFPGLRGENIRLVY